MIAVKSENSDLKMVERLNPDGTVARFEGFKQLKKGDRFRMVDDPIEGIWVAICDPFAHCADLPDRLAIRAYVENKKELQVR